MTGSDQDRRQRRPAATARLRLPPSVSFALRYVAESRDERGRTMNLELRKWNAPRVAMSSKMIQHAQSEFDMLKERVYIGD